MRTEEGLLLLDDHGSILWSNIVAAELLGFSKAELCGMALPLIGEQTPANDKAVTQRIRFSDPVSGDVVQPAPSVSVGPVASAFRSILIGEFTEAEGAARIPDKADRRIAVHWRLWGLPRSGGGRQVLLSISETAQAAPDGPITSGYRDVFEHAVEGIYRSSFEGQLLEVNPALARMCGYGSAAEMIDCIQDLNTQIYVRPHRRGEFMLELREHGSVDGFESEVFRADGSVFWAAEFARIVSSPDGVPVHVEGSVIDISKRKQAEAALQLSEEKFRSLVETTRVVPFEFHPATQDFVYMGPQAETVFECAIGTKMTWDRWASMLHPDDRQVGMHFAQFEASQLQRDSQAEFRICAAGGRVIWIKQIAHFASYEDPSDALVRGFFLDVTEAKKLEAEQERTRIQLRELTTKLQEIREEERSTIAGEIHDEVGQALTLLKLDLAWITARVGQPGIQDALPVLAERVAMMDRKLDSAFAAVRGILLELRPPLLEELGLKDAMEFHLAEVARRVGFRFDLDVIPEPAITRRAKVAVFRIFQEAITNVAKHSKASRVKVLLWDFGEELFMTVEDNGCGITQESQKKPMSYGLMGIREMAFAMGGEVHVHGATGGGTSVTLRIPLGQCVASKELPAQIPLLQRARKSA